MDEIKDTRINAMGIYMSGFERVRIPIDANMKTSIKIKVLQDQEGNWRAGHDVECPGFLSNRPVCNKSMCYVIKTYKSRKEALVDEAEGIIALLKSKYNIRCDHEIVGALKRFIKSQEQMELDFFIKGGLSE